MGRDTEKILDHLSGTGSLTEFFQENKEVFNLLTIGEYIELELKNRKLTKASIIRKSGINKRFFFDILAGKKTPSRRYIIRLFLALNVDFSDVQWYLKACDYPQLYVKNKRDSIIIYCLNNKLTVSECNKMLNNVDLENLGFENI
ncbi:MAG: helix-turn-helix transcriptional regulator [Clostridiales bacterium]|nr:helix-turn-helix transcriptional regulator [Clostridiales bacterium]